MKFLKASIGIICALIAINSSAEKQNFNVLFDDFKIVKEEKVIYSVALFESDIQINKLYHEEETLVFTKSIESQVVDKFCSISKLKDLINYEKYSAEIEIFLDTGEKYMITSLNECFLQDTNN